MVDFDDFTEALKHVWAVEEEHGERDFAVYLQRLGIEDGERIRNALAPLAQQLQQERPELQGMPDAAVGLGLAYGFVIGVRAERESGE